MGVGVVGVLWAEPPPQDAGELSKICKNSINKVQKCIILAYFKQKLAYPALNFCAFGRNTQIVEKFLQEIQ